MNNEEDNKLLSANEIEFVGSDESYEIKDFTIDTDNVSIEKLETGSNISTITELEPISFSIEFESISFPESDDLVERMTEDDWEYHQRYVSELDRKMCCPNCGKDFDQTSWKPISGFDAPLSYRWEYGCPTDTCRTAFVVSRNDL